MKVTVSILTYTETRLSEKCVESVMRQSLPCQLILTANGNADAATLFSRLSRVHPERVRAVVNETNQGFIQPNLHALEMTDTPFFLMLNDDAQLPPDGLRALLDPFKHDDKLALVGVFGGCSRLREDFEGCHGIEYEYAEGSCLMCRTEIVKALGLFDPLIHFAYCEDADLSLRVREAGYHIQGIRLDIRHVRNATARRIRGLHEILERNKAYCAHKWALYLKTRCFEEQEAVR